MYKVLRAAIVALALPAALLAGRSGWAAELSTEQVRAVLSAASPSKPADLAGKDLSDLDLSGVDFRGANLRGASFFGSKLVLANLRGAKLEGANLNGAWLMGTDFTGADLTRASLLSVVILHWLEVTHETTNLDASIGFFRIGIPLAAWLVGRRLVNRPGNVTARGSVATEHP